MKTALISVLSISLLASATACVTQTETIIASPATRRTAYSVPAAAIAKPEESPLPVTDANGHTTTISTDSLPPAPRNYYPPVRNSAPNSQKSVKRRGYLPTKVRTYKPTQLRKKK